MSIESVKDVARKVAYAHGRGEVETLRELLSPSLVWRIAGVANEMGRDDYLRGYSDSLRAFSDFSLTIEDEIVEDDRVAHRWTIQMRHTGAYEGIDPTNRALTFTAVWVYRVVDRKVVEAWSIDEDVAALLREQAPFAVDAPL